MEHHSLHTAPCYGFHTQVFFTHAIPGGIRCVWRMSQVLLGAYHCIASCPPPQEPGWHEANHSPLLIMLGWRWWRWGLTFCTPPPSMAQGTLILSSPPSITLYLNLLFHLSLIELALILYRPYYYFARTVVKFASFSLGTHTYRRYSALFQWPKVCMSESSTP